MSFSYDLMFDRIICVLVRIKVKGHLVMSIIQFMNLISLHFWTCLKSRLKKYQQSQHEQVLLYVQAICEVLSDIVRLLDWVGLDDFI